MAAFVWEIFWLHFWTVTGSGDASAIIIFSGWRGVWQKLQDTSGLRQQQNCTLGNVGTRFWPEKKVGNKKNTLWRRSEAEAHRGASEVSPTFRSTSRPSHDVNPDHTDKLKCDRARQTFIFNLKCLNYQQFHYCVKFKPRRDDSDVFFLCFWRFTFFVFHQLTTSFHLMLRVNRMETKKQNWL